MELKSKATAVESKKQEFLINDKDIEMSSNVDIPRYILKFVSSVVRVIAQSIMNAQIAVKLNIVKLLAKAKLAFS